MTKRALFDQLARSNHHIARGKEHIAQQRDIIVALEIWGLDAGRSVELLNTFLETQRLHEKERDSLESCCKFPLRRSPRTTSGSFSPLFCQKPSKSAPSKRAIFKFLIEQLSRLSVALTPNAWNHLSALKPMTAVLVAEH